MKTFRSKITHKTRSQARFLIKKCLSLEMSKDHNNNVFHFSWNTNKLSSKDLISDQRLDFFSIDFHLKAMPFTTLFLLFFSSALIMFLRNASLKTYIFFSKVLFFCSRLFMSVWSNSFWICCWFMSLSWCFS